MGTELTGQIEIRNVKGDFPPDPLWNTATDFHFEAVYEHGVTLIISNKNRLGEARDLPRFSVQRMSASGASETLDFRLETGDQR